MLFRSQDNADLRLSKVGYDAGLLSESRYRKVEAKAQSLQTEIARLASTRLDGVPLAKLLRRPGARYLDLPSADTTLPKEVMEQVEMEVKYAGYLDRQHADVKRLKSLDKKRIPESIDYNAMTNLFLRSYF